MGLYGGYMERILKNKVIASSIILAVVCAIGIPAMSADTLIYSNTDTAGFYANIDGASEYLDFGYTTGGHIKKFTVGYVSASSSTVSARVRFYRYTSNGYIPGAQLKTYVLSMPGTSGYANTYTYSIPPSNQFDLPAGNFGYSIEFISSNCYPILAGGGQGNQNIFWYYWDLIDSWYSHSYSDTWNGFHLKLYAGEVETCRFSGYVYQDLAEDGTKSAGDPALEDWRIFVDENGNRKYDFGEPNDFTDSNGYYNIPNASIDSFDALCQQTRGGWKPVYPESGYWQPWISANGSYVLNFGNKQHGEGTITGYKFDDSDANGEWNNGEPVLQGWRIYIDENKNGQFESTEPNDITDPNGFYEIPGLDAPADHTVAEVMQNGWNQSLPGGEGTYTVSTEPNTVTPEINFGNTTQPVITEITISGHVLLSDGSGFEGVLMQATGSRTGVTSTDENGYYEIKVTSGWSGNISPSKPKWVFNLASTLINVTSDMTLDFTAYWPYSGGDGTELSPYLIATPQDLNAIGHQPKDWVAKTYFKMTDDIDLSGYTEDSFNIIGSKSQPFSGVFDGNSKTISNFTYTTLASESYIGIFGYADYEGPYRVVIKDLTIISPDISAHGSYVGSLVGYFDNGIISNCKVQDGNIDGYGSVGGLVGYNNGRIQNASATGAVSGDYSVGGLVGECENSSTWYCYSNANVSGGDRIGGLVGKSDESYHLECSTKGTVSGYELIGGIAGELTYGAISRSLSSATVTGTGTKIGGLAGETYVSDSKDCYATGIVTGNDYVGGLIGSFYGHSFGRVIDCYSTAKAIGTGGSRIGGLIGITSEPHYILNSFWDTEKSQIAKSSGGTGLKTDQMHEIATYLNASWDFTAESANGTDNYWRICDGYNYPHLSWEEKTPGDITCPDGVGLEDLAELASQWQLTKLESDFQTDGKVDLTDWSIIAAAWQTNSVQPNYDQRCDIAPTGGNNAIDAADLAIFATQWMTPSATNADIAPQEGDKKVNTEDLKVIAENWLMGR